MQYCRLLSFFVLLITLMTFSKIVVAVDLSIPKDQQEVPENNTDGTEGTELQLLKDRVYQARVISVKPYDYNSFTPQNDDYGAWRGLFDEVNEVMENFNWFMAEFSCQISSESRSPPISTFSGKTAPHACSS